MLVLISLFEVLWIPMQEYFIKVVVKPTPRAKPLTSSQAAFWMAGVYSR
jgi:hypothetical protein